MRDDPTIQRRKRSKALELGVGEWRKYWVRVMAKRPTPRDTRMKTTGMTMMRRRFRCSFDEPLKIISL